MTDAFIISCTRLTSLSFAESEGREIFANAPYTVEAYKITYLGGSPTVFVIEEIEEQIDLKGQP